MATTTVIKSPRGAALEYAKHSFSAYKRCPNMCSYCYLNRGVLRKELGPGKPELRSCFKSEDDVIQRFEGEVVARREELIEDGGIFFSFITDPCLPETFELTRLCAIIAMYHDVPVTILTKMTSWINAGMTKRLFSIGGRNKLLCVGFTLTGHDEMEPKADSNDARILAMEILHDRGIKTFASIEPIIDFDTSLKMIERTIDFCDLYRIGLRSGVKSDYYDPTKLALFIGQVEGLIDVKQSDTKVYWKESVRQRISFDCSDFWTHGHFVNSDYNIFKDY